MKKTSIVLLAGVLILAFGCMEKGEEVEEVARPVVSEGFVEAEVGVELRYKTIGNGPQAVVIPAAMYLEYEFERLIDEDRTLIFYDMRGRGKSRRAFHFSLTYWKFTGCRRLADERNGFL